MKKPVPDRLAREFAKSPDDAKGSTRLPALSPNPATNLVIANIVLRGASSLLRDNVEKRIARATSDDEEKAREMLDGRTMITSLALYGASKLATRSPLGLGIVVAGLAMKTLYDRGTMRRARLRREATRETGEE